MKKIIIGILSFAFLFIGGQNVFADTASNVWNGDSNDCATLSIANIDTNAGLGDPCWTGKNVSAQPGETINVRIYYHNTNSKTNTNTRIKLNTSSLDASTRHSFSAMITSDQGGKSSSTVSVNLPSSLALIPKSAIWYPNQGQSQQTISGLTSSDGFYVGDVSADTDNEWPSQGSIVMSYKVEKVVAVSCSIDNFTADGSSSASITSGDSSSLSWSTSNCTSANISSVGSVSTSGSKSVSPTTTTTYTLTAYGSTGSPVSKSVTVNVNPVIVTSPCSIDEFIADGYSSISIVSGDFVKLKWLTSHCTSATISNLNYSIPVSGVQDVYPTVTTTYTLTAYGSTGSPKTASVTVYVNQPAVCSINSFYANPTSITSGDSSSLSWSTSNCTNASISSVGSVSTSGSKSVSPTTTTTYTLTAYGSTGSPKTASVTVYVNQPAVCVINYFTADGSSSTSITSGESATLAWNTSNCTNVAISNLNYNVPTSGTQSVWPTVTTTYKLTANGLAGATQTKSVTVSVNEVTPNCSINSFYASPNSITSGDSSTLVWTTSNCTKATISNLNYNVPTSGDQDVWPTTTTTYTLTAYGSTGSPVSKSVKVNVTSVAVCSINNFTADGSSSTSITSGESATLAWNTSNCTNASISSVGSVSTSGSRSVSPTTTTTYTLTAYGSTGSPKTASVTVYVNQPAVCSINSFYANPTSITSGDSSSLYWSTDNCTRVTISNLNYNVPTSSISGGQSIWPTTTTTYVLTAYGSSGSTKTASATVYVNNVITSCVIDSFYASDYSINEGDSTTLRWETTNCQNVKISNIGSVSDDGSRKVYPDNDITYTLTAYDSNGNHRTKSVDINVDEEDDDDNDNCSIDKFSASDSYIDKGDSVELKWNTTNCDDVSITDLGDVSDDGKETVYPHTTTTYKLRASGNNGNTKTKTLKINVGDEQQYTYYNTNVITTVATNISQNGAQVNGLITSSNYTNANVYFEYGTTVNLGMRTSSYSTNGNTNFSDYLTNLSPNTIYYFQAVSSGANGISRGAIEVFRTTGYTTNYNNYYNYDSGTTTKTVRQIVVQGETVYGSESPVILRIENRYQTVSIGDTIDYTVYYKNISSSTLHDPMIQVYIPEGVILTNSSHGTYSEDDRILSVPIDDLIPGEEGFLYLQAEVESIDVSLAQIVTTAVIIYTNPSGSQNNAMAYVLNNPKLTNNNALGASAFFSGLTNIGLIGWLLIIIFIMLIILIARSLYNRKGEIVMVPTYIEKNRQ